MTDPSSPEAVADPVRRMLAIMASLVLCIGVIGSCTSVTGTITARGTIVTSKSALPVSQKSGGIVATVHVEEGQTVAQGDVLFTLDTAPLEKALSRIQTQQATLRLRQARLESISENLDGMRIPPNLQTALTSLGLEALLTAEQKLYEADRQARDAHAARLRREHLRSRARALDLQQEILAKEQEIDIVTRAIEDLKKNGNKDAQMNIREDVASERVLEQRRLGLERDRARLAGELQRLKAARNEAEAQRDDLGRQLQDIDRDERRRALSDLSDLAAKLQALDDEARTLTSEIEANRVTAPASGIVRDLAIGTSAGASNRTPS